MNKQNRMPEISSKLCEWTTFEKTTTHARHETGCEESSRADQSSGANLRAGAALWGAPGRPHCAAQRRPRGGHRAGAASTSSKSVITVI